MRKAGGIKTAKVKPIYNFKGEVIEEGDLKLKSSRYGRKKKDGRYKIYWAEPDDFVDAKGFDKRYKGTDGYYDILILVKGTRLARYGWPGGELTTLAGTPYEWLGLPYVKETIEYHEYEVITDKCVVKRGVVSPMFDSCGGAFQFLHFGSIQDELCLHKNLKEIHTWRIGKKTKKMAK